MALVRRGVQAMGGEQALRSLSNSTMEFNSAAFGLGQEETPSSPARATIASGRVTVDYAGNRRAIRQELRTVNGQVINQRRVTANGIGMVEANNTINPDPPATVTTVERGVRLLPERLLLAALDNPRALSGLAPRRLRGELADGLRYVNGPDTVSLWFDRMNGLLLATEAIADDPVLGDRNTLTWYTRWQDAGGVLLPRQVDVEADGRLQQHAVYTAVTTNGALGDTLFAIPDSIVQRAQRAAPPVVVTLAELAPGVWRAEGGSHHSLVVEQPARLVVVEAPLNAERSRAVLDTLRSRFPTKRVGTVVMSHHHWDHSGGVREYLAQSVPVVAHRRNADFVRRVGSTRKTIAPDALSRRPRAATVQTVSDSLTLGAGDSRVVLYTLPSAHAEGILAAYLPTSRLLFVVDVLSPGPNLPRPGSAEVAALARQRGITVDRVVGGHGGIAAWADVERAAQ
ncbi:MAG: MBL fold metallo-hydrolase [Gemmatimonadaceae bacterium]